MAEQRRDVRVDCEVKCLLRLGDLGHEAMVKNFSLGGALVNFHPPTPVLHIGDNCKISMHGGSLCEYSCKVVRVETANIALMFTATHEFKPDVQRVRNTH